MVDLRAPLNTRQAEVLRWIADGCPDGVMTGHSHKTSAAALEWRGLVAVTKKGGAWQATVTDNGRHYLDHGEFPPADPAPPESLRAQATASSQPVGKATPPGPPGWVVGEQLIAELEAAGGVIEIDTRTDKTDYRSRMQSAKRWGKVPKGKHLIYHQVSGNWHRYELRLEDVPAWRTAELEPIPVPETLRGAHPVVSALRDRHAIKEIAGPARQRALRLIQALAAEAVRRGYEVQIAPEAGQRYRRRSQDWDDDFTIDPGGHAVGIHIRQHHDRVKHVPTAAELARQVKSPWLRLPTHDKTPTERLGIHVSGPHQHHQSIWNDNKLWLLEEKLPQILQEVELRAAAAEVARLEAERAARERQRRWETAMAQAKIDLRESHRAKVLGGQLADWRQAEELRAYLEAMRRAIGTMEPAAAGAAGEWLGWVEQHVARLDPLGGKLAMPADPEATPEALKPFLKGWSPYGPDERRY